MTGTQQPETQYDNDLARAIDAESAAKMEEAGCDIKFLGFLRPSFRDRSTGVWSTHTIDEFCLLAESLEEMQALVAEHDAAQERGWEAVCDFMLTRGFPRRSQILHKMMMQAVREPDLMARFCPESPAALLVDRSNPLAGHQYRRVRIARPDPVYADYAGRIGLLTHSFKYGGRWYHKVHVGTHDWLDLHTEAIEPLEEPTQFPPLEGELHAPDAANTLTLKITNPEPDGSLVAGRTYTLAARGDLIPVIVEQKNLAYVSLVGQPRMACEPRWVRACDSPRTPVEFTFKITVSDPGIRQISAGLFSGCFFLAGCDLEINVVEPLVEMPIRPGQRSPGDCYLTVHFNTEEGGRFATYHLELEGYDPALAARQRALDAILADLEGVGDGRLGRVIPQGSDEKGSLFVLEIHEGEGRIVSVGETLSRIAAAFRRALPDAGHAGAWFFEKHSGGQL